MSIDRSDKGLARNAALILGAEVIVQVTRALTIIILSSVFTGETFGTYVALLALTTLLGPVSQWGMNHVGVRAVAHGLPFAETWAKVTSTIAAGGIVGTALTTILGFALLDVRPSVALLFGVAQLIGLNTARASTMMTEAHHRSDVGLRINLTGAAIRFVLLAAFVLSGFDDLFTWSLFLAVGMTSWGLVSSLRVARAFGGTHGLALPSGEDLRHGLGFVFVQTSASGQADVDKLVLGAEDLKVDAGIYSLAYRMVEMSTVPLIAVVRATYAEFFRRGSETVAEAMRFAKRLTAIAAGYGIAAGLALVLGAPLILLILDDTKYGDSVDAMKWLAFIPFVKGLQYFPGNALTGADHHNVRSWIIFATAVVNLIANLIFIPRYGWQAAAVTTLVAETLFAALLWSAVSLLARRERRSASVVV